MRNKHPEHPSHRLHVRQLRNILNMTLSLSALFERKSVSYKHFSSYYDCFYTSTSMALRIKAQGMIGSKSNTYSQNW